LKNKPRKPWIAGALTFFSIGLGHLYHGDLKKGVILFFGGQLFLILAYSSFLFYPPYGLVIAFIVVLFYLIYCIVDAVKGAKVFKISYTVKKYNRWYIYLLYWFVATIVIQSNIQIAVKNNIVQNYKIPSGAMKPTIQIGDRIIVDKLTYKNSEPKRGDIVIFPFPEDPSKDFTKRIVGMGGESIEIKNKQVFINGDPYQEDYAIYNDSNVFPKNEQPRDNFGPVKIPEDSLFVMGDNRDQSYDSRFWGFVKKSSVKGRIKGIYCSWDKENSRVRWGRIGKKVN
jgi:signal peptidase I